jgi:hypothetical protein
MVGEHPGSVMRKARGRDWMLKSPFGLTIRLPAYLMHFKGPGKSESFTVTERL